MSEERDCDGRPLDIPEEIWEDAYDRADVHSDIYGCDHGKRMRLTEEIARARLAERVFCAGVISAMLEKLGGEVSIPAGDGLVERDFVLELDPGRRTWTARFAREAAKP